MMKKILIWKLCDDQREQLSYDCYVDPGTIYLGFGRIECDSNKNILLLTIDQLVASFSNGANFIIY